MIETAVKKEHVEKKIIIWKNGGNKMRSRKKIVYKLTRNANVSEVL